MSNSENGDSELDDYEMNMEGGGMDAEENAAGNDDIDTEEEEMLLEDGKHYLEETDSDDDDDTDEEDEVKLTGKYLAVLEDISKEPANYDNYVRLVDVAHEITDLTKIRESCELFSTTYPLAPEIWLRWLKIELNIATDDTELKHVHHLFRRAFADYYSAEIALEYANLAARLPKSNDVWEEIISTYALHAMHGRALFEAWRAHINHTEKDSPQRHTKLLETYERELALPLNGMEETYIELKVICEKDKENYANVDWARIDAKYQKAKKNLATMLPFEELLQTLTAREHLERAKVYTKYIDECKPLLDESIVQVLYERMVTDCCLNASCWLAYIRYIQKREDSVKPSSQSIQVEISPVFNQTDWDIVNRALRNCTWSAELYVEKIFIGERMELPKQEVQNIAECAFAATINEPTAFYTVWIEYISYLRRNTNMTNEKEVEMLRANLMLGWETLEKQYADPYCELLKIWGRLEYGQLHDTAKGKELWTNVVASVNNRCNAAIWIEFAHLELEAKGCDAARKIYRKAVGVADIDDIHIVTSAWTRLERCYGTLDQLKLCQSQCQSALNVYNERVKGRNFRPDKSQQPRANANRHTPKDNKSKAKGKPNDARNNEKKAQNQQSLNPRKHKLTATEHGGAEKRSKFEPNANRNAKQTEPPSSSDKDAVTVFISNISYEITADEIIAAFPELKIQNLELPTSPNGRGRGFGYIELSSSDEVALALSFDRRPINGRPAFLSNVSRDKEKRPKFKYAVDIEPNKVFVKGLPSDVTKEAIEGLFAEFGAVKDIRVVTHKSGLSKGIAYVEFEEASAASRAVFKLDQTEFQNSTLSVAISRPPPQPLPANSRGLPSSQSAANLVGLGQGRRNKVTERGEQKPRLTFIPRAVLKNVAAPTSSDSTEPTPNSEPPLKSNEDFRKMLLKK